MNIEERKNVRFHVISAALLLLSIGVDIFALLKVIFFNPGEIFLDILAITVALFFTGFEIFFNLKKPKNESMLFQICFNENQKINTIPLAVISLGSAFGLGLIAMSLAVYFIRTEPGNKAAMMVVLAIGGYTIVNCLIYWIYIIMFRKREINLKDFIK